MHVKSLGPFQTQALRMPFGLLGHRLAAVGHDLLADLADALQEAVAAFPERDVLDAVRIDLTERVDRAPIRGAGICHHGLRVAARGVEPRDRLEREMIRNT